MQDQCWSAADIPKTLARESDILVCRMPPHETSRNGHLAGCRHANVDKFGRSRKNLAEVRKIHWREARVELAGQQFFTETATLQNVQNRYPLMEVRQQLHP